MEVVDQIYNLRRNFIVIGLTGRTGSGCTTVAEILEREDVNSLKSDYKEFNDAYIDDNVRKNRIVHDFIKKNWQPFQVIKVSDIIFYYALKQDFATFVQCIVDADVVPAQSKVSKKSDSSIAQQLDSVKKQYEVLKRRVEKCEHVLEGKKYEKNKALIIDNKKLILEDISEFRQNLNAALAKTSKKVITKELQVWGNNIRQYNSICKQPCSDEKSPSCLAYKINQFIKMFRTENKLNDKPTLIVIDALRNPYEILYFRERYAAFYTISVNTEEGIRQKKLQGKDLRNSEIVGIDDVERGKKDFQDSYQLIDIDKCIELSDIHLTHDGTTIRKNHRLINQVFTYVALILHPGLVSPSPLERIMQIAFTAKLNSGCLSRQVGAVVTNEYYAVQAVGWNTVAEGQTPCSLRSLCDLVNQEDDKAYSTYEKEDENFSEYIHQAFGAYEKGDFEEKMHGLGLPYCFKDVYTSINSDKQKGNQVHTRSLHAEENAFLQLAKYGSQGIKGGKLFTTASCCELCAKKAYQLGIKEIYYIDSYPGISKSHILECGDLQPKMILFSGAIGRAYVSLYNPFLPLKDEIEAITNVKIKEINNFGLSGTQKRKSKK